MRSYPQADPPGPITCAVYFFTALVLMSGVIFVLAKGFGLI